MQKNSKGFTLIEMIIAMLISSLVIIGVSTMFKFVAVNWLGQVRRVLSQDDLTSLSSMINIQYKNVYFFNKKKYFVGDDNYLTFLTRDSGTFIPGVVQVFYQYEDNKIKGCFNPLRKYEEVKNKIEDFEEDFCFEIKDITDGAFSYFVKFGNRAEWRDSIKNIPPQMIKLELNLKNSDEKRDIYVLP